LVLEELDSEQTMDKMADLIIRLNRLGYRTQTFEHEIIVELDERSRIRGTCEQIERILPTLSKGANSRMAVFSGYRELQRRIAAVPERSGLKRAVRTKRSKKKKRGHRKKGKIKVISARIPTASIETQGWARSTRFRKSRSQGGLPGLGKHR
jgi:hypothetical protein